MTNNLPAIQTRHNVTVVPYDSAWVGGPDIARIPVSGRICYGGKFQDRFPSQEIHFDPPLIRGHFLYGGPLKIHFGHFLTDSIIRLWAFDPEKHDGVVFPVLDRGNLPNWMYEIMEIFGVQKHHVIPVFEAFRFEHLDFAEPGSALGSGPNQWYLDLLTKTVRLNTKEAVPKRVFFGRSHIIGRGTLMGETYFENKLVQNGFHFIKPECFDIRSQLCFLEKAKQIVFTEGSSIYAIELLARTRAKIFMIPRRSGGSALFSPHVMPKARVFRVLGSEYDVIRMENRNGVNRPNSPSYSLRPDRIHYAMVRYGLIRPSLFSMSDFADYERRDALTYFVKREAIAETQLAHINRNRLDRVKRSKNIIDRIINYFNQ